MKVKAKSHRQCQHRKEGACTQCARTFKSAGTFKKQTPFRSDVRHKNNRLVALIHRAQAQNKAELVYVLRQMPIE